MKPDRTPSRPLTLIANEDAEIAVLGAMLLDELAIVTARAIIKEATEFSRTAHQLVFSAMTALHDAGTKVDPVTLADHLDRAGDLGHAGGKAFIGILLYVVPTAANVEYHAHLVHEDADRRRLYAMGLAMAKAAEERQSPRDIAQAASKLLVPYAGAGTRRGFITVGDGVDDTLESIRRAGTSPQSGGVLTGYPEIDRQTFGFRAGEFVVFAGSPSAGKSALAINLMHNAATEQGCRIGFVSAEMGQAQVTARLLGLLSGVSVQTLRSGNLGVQQQVKLDAAAAKLRSLPIHVDACFRPKPDDVFARCRHLKVKHPDLGLLVVDYIQMLKGSGGDHRAFELTEMSYDLAGLAKELEVVVIALSQVNAKEVERRDESKRAHIADLKWSDGMREAAHFVGLIHRPPVPPDSTPRIEVNFEKARDLPTFYVNLEWQGATMRVDSPLRRSREVTEL